MGDRGFGIGIEDIGAGGLGLGFRVSRVLALGVWGSRVEWAWGFRG